MPDEEGSRMRLGMGIGITEDSPVDVGTLN
jgi:hypothetical protein